MAYDIFEAARLGKTERVDYFLNLNVSPDVKTEKDITPLFLSSACGQLETAKLLIEKGAAVNVQIADEMNTTALIIAAENGHGDVVRLLLENGAYSTTEPECRALLAAIHKGHKDVVSIILEYTSDINTKILNGRYEETPLFIACKNGYKEIAEILIRYGADVNITVENTLSDYLEEEEASYFFLENQLDTNNQCIIKTVAPIQAAATGDYAEIVELLLKNGADMNIQTKFTPNLLNICVQSSAVNTAKLLIRKGIIFNDDTPSNPSPLQLATNLHVSEEMIEFLLENKAKLCPSCNLRYTNYFVLYDYKKPKFLAPSSCEDWENCKDELRMMKQYTFNKASLTLYNFIKQSDENRLMTFISNHDVQTKLKTKFYTTSFPKFSRIIERRYQVGVLRLSLLTKARMLMSELFPNIPDLVRNKIVNYMSNNDLEKFTNPTRHKKKENRYIRSRLRAYQKPRFF